MNFKITFRRTYLPLVKQIRRLNNASNYKSVVGLEIHAQIAANSKLFSGACTHFGSPANKNVSLFDAAIPGTLPVLNKRCVEAAVITALALSCKINSVSMFDRKHYFYADLPAGYQITQQRNPLAINGNLDFQVYLPGKHKEPYKKSSRIKQIQLEQDSGKTLHDLEEKRSLVDLNRAGVPLMELVFEPDLSDGEEAAALVKELSLILMRLKTCSCKMEEGALRVDANVSVHLPNEPLGVRTEIKNIGSIRGVASAISYEIKRQIELIANGEEIFNETRAWDAVSKLTVPMRDKEEKQDYRFMPEPNLPPLHLKMPGMLSYFEELVDVDTISKQIPELPNETRLNLINSSGLSTAFAITLVNENSLLQYFRDIMTKANRDPKIVANVLIMELLTVVHKNKIFINDCLISSIHLGDIVDLLQSNIINLVTVRKVLQELISGNTSSPQEIVNQNNWAQIVDDEEITRLCVDCLERNPKLVQQFKNGKSKMFQALVGDIAKNTQQRANMSAVVKKMQELLKK